MYRRGNTLPGEVIVSLARGNPDIRRISTTPEMNWAKFEKHTKVHSLALTDLTSQAYARLGFTPKDIGNLKEITTRFRSPLTFVNTEIDFLILKSWQLSAQDSRELVRRGVHLDMRS